jgi:anaerobic dimethyl sulfoxide reductase subunit A
MALLDKSIARRDFLRGSAAAAATFAVAGAIGCSPKEETGSEKDGDLVPHVVDSDTAIIEGRGQWMGVRCPKGCSFACAPCEYVVDNVAIRSKVVDYLADSEDMPQLRGCHAFKTGRTYIYGPSRIKYPMKRKGWQPGGGESSNGQMRGKDEWERISWDEALDISASEIKRIYDTYGPACTFSFLSEGSGLQSILSSMGGYIEFADTISCGVWQADTAWWGLPYYGNGTGVDAQDYLNADYLVMAGQDFVFTSIALTTTFMKAKEKGVQFIYIGPCYNQMATQLEARWIPVRPGTDIAFWTGVAYEMVKLDEARGNIIDWDFLAKYTVGFDKDHMPADAKLDECYLGYLQGEYDGLPKTAEWASRICGTTVEDIRYMADVLGKENKVLLTQSNGATRNTGVENYPQAFHTLGLMGGHMGQSGNSTFTFLFLIQLPSLARTGASGRGVSAIKNPLGYETEPGQNLYGIPSAGRVLISAPLHWRAMLEGKFTSYGANCQETLPAVYNKGVEHEVNVKLIWNGRRNHLSSSMDLFNAVKVYRNAEFVLTQAVWASTAARFSDIVLPVSSSWEGSLDQTENNWPGGAVNQYSGRDFCAVNHPVCEPLWESRSDNRIWRDLAQRLGLDPDTIAADNALQAYFDAMAGGTYTDTNGEKQTLLTITQTTIEKYGVALEPQEGVVEFEVFVEHGGFYVPREQGDSYSKYNGYQAFYNDPGANPLSTPSGLWEIYCQSKADNFNTPGFVDPANPVKPYPNYYEPTMGYQKTFSDWENQIKGDFPYQLYNFHPSRRSHSDGWSQVGKECYPHPLYINPIDARNLDLVTGDTARIWNPDGGCILRQVVLMEGTMPGCVGLAEGGNMDIDESDPQNWIDRGGAVNVVTSAVRSNYMPSLSGYNNGIVNIEKYKGEPLVPDAERDPFVIEEA